MTTRRQYLHENPDTMAELSRIVSDVDDRAWVICERHSSDGAMSGKCTIFAVKDVLPMRPDTLCANYKKLHGEA